MTAYDYLESEGLEPKEGDLELMSDATTMLSALGRLRSLCREGGVEAHEAFLAAVDEQYDKLVASSGGEGILSREAFHAVCADIWRDSRP